MGTHCSYPEARADRCTLHCLHKGGFTGFSTPAHSLSLSSRGNFGASFVPFPFPVTSKRWVRSCTCQIRRAFENYQFRTKVPVFVIQQNRQELSVHQKNNDSIIIFYGSNFACR